jgi:uncharacterized protein
LKLQLSNTPNQKIFTEHGPGYVAVSGQRFEQPVVVTPQQVLTDWTPRDFATLEESHFEYFLAFQPEVVVIGTGERLQFPHPRLYRQLIEARIGVEFMDNAAACRTFDILVSEDRKVVAAILL